ncbi:unnamed protein product [Effrenium voratum]|uniref:PDZ domain-containing protein n=1 Tax=Effrenium voratum TaxID=2562239 RepID=A0AA36JLS6_9DINO|nr:unnamed protein product [Effrenium voratum]CAJ1438853.1 unnamed protein product [Effrenium voratum]
MEFEVEVSAEGRVLGLVPEAWPPGPVRVAAVLANSVAAENDIRVGDELAMVNGLFVSSLDHHSLARELSNRPLRLLLQRHAQPDGCMIIDVRAGPDDGAIGFFPKNWPPGPVVVGAVLPSNLAARNGVQEGDLLWLVEGKQAALMSSADLTKSLSQRPLSLRFLRGDALEYASHVLGSGKISIFEPPSEHHGIIEQTQILQVQQLHLQQLQHSQEQGHYPKVQKESQATLERQNDERRTLQLMQKQHMSHLHQTFRAHQQLLEELPVDGESVTPETHSDGRRLRGKPPKPRTPQKRTKTQSPNEQDEQSTKRDHVIPQEQTAHCTQFTQTDVPSLEDKYTQPEAVATEEFPSAEVTQTDMPELKKKAIQPDPDLFPLDRVPSSAELLESESITAASVQEMDLPALVPLSSIEPRQPDTIRRTLPDSSGHVSGRFHWGRACSPSSHAEPLDKEMNELRLLQRTLNTNDQCHGLKLRELPPPQRPPAGEVRQDAQEKQSETRTAAKSEVVFSKLQKWLDQCALSQNAVIF